MATQASNLSFIDNAQGQITISATTATTSTTTGALIVTGGVGIGGTVYVGSLRGDTTTSATTWGLFYNPVTKEITTATSGSGAVSISSTGTTSTFVISSTASSVSTNTGALQVVGGVGIGGNLNVGGVITATNFFAGSLRIDAGSTMTLLVVSGTATSTSTTTGAVIVTGGVGIGGSVNIGGSVTGGGIRTSSTSTAPANPTVGDIWYNTATDDIYRYTTDGTTSAWLDITGPSGATSSVTSSAQPVFSVNNTGSQVIATGSPVKVQFNVKLVDTNNNYDSTTNYRFTPTVAGYYQINAAVRDATGGANQIATFIYKNGSSYAQGVSLTSGQGASSNISQIVFCNGTTDYIEVYAQQNSGSNMTIGGDYQRNYFSGYYAGTGIGYISGTNTYNGVAQILSAAPLTAPVIKDSTGTEIGRLARAWVNFRGATAVIDSSFNVSSVTRASAGVYTVNFTNAFTDTLYAIAGTASTDGVTYNGFLNPGSYVSNKSTGSTALTTIAGTGAAGTAYDPYSVYVIIFR
jgi:hypothetical protein